MIEIIRMRQPILRSLRPAAISAFWAILLPTVLLGQGLAPSVQADLLRNQIVEQAKANNPEAVLATLDQYHKLVTDNNLMFPPPLYLIEAKAAHDAGVAQRALSALAQFLNSSDHSSAQYKEALALYPEYEKRSAGEAQQVLRAAGFGDLESLMVAIPGGSFRMGDLSGNYHFDELPVHTVTIKPFRLSKYKLQLKYWRAYHMADPSSAEGCGSDPDAPVACVSWEDAHRFTAWLNSHGEHGFRLPTEAEWEYAARAGSTTRYPWGDDDDASKRQDYNDFNVTPPGKYPPNGFGLFEMIGYPMEWVQDCYNINYDGAPSDGSAGESGPSIDGTGKCSRVVRGWAPRDMSMPKIGPYPAHILHQTVSKRGGGSSAERAKINGFRLAQDN